MRFFSRQEKSKPVKEIKLRSRKNRQFSFLKRSLPKLKKSEPDQPRRQNDDDPFEELEEQLLIADVGVETTRKNNHHLDGRRILQEASQDAEAPMAC